MLRYEIFNARELLSFPDGDNSTDTVFGGVHFNTSVLDHWNYTYYSNGTLSNGTKCWLTFAPYEPVRLLNNGSFINATTCYSAINPIAGRGFTGIAFAVAFALALLLNLTALAKHGKMYLPKTRRFYPIGRRWQWYWGCIASATALISLFTNVDVDRYYIQSLPIIVTTFFWFIMCQATVALCWEAVRHWGSWLERQYIDPNPFVYREDDRRSKVEFWLPLWTYFWIWMNFFMVVPRSWNFVEMQRSPELTDDKTIPTATGIRFKIAGFCLAVSWFTVLYSLRHSVRYYKPRNRGVFNRTMGFARAVPLRFALMIPLTAAVIAYQIIITFIWDFSVMKAHGNIPIIYGWGYGPTLAILFVQALYGYFSPNEDKDLLRQRRERGEDINRELGYVKKPAWWKRVNGEHIQGNMRDKILRNVTEIGGGRATGRRIMDDQERYVREEDLRMVNNDTIEMSTMSKGTHNPRVDRAGAKSMYAQDTPILPPVDTSTGGQSSSNSGGLLGELASPPPPYASPDSERTQPFQSMERANSTSSMNSISAPPQQVRSMLDV